MRALTEFLLRESLALLLDDPTPRRVAQEMGNEPPAVESQATEEMSEDSESQAFAPLSNPHRAMMVRATNSAQQLATLVDRSFSVDVFFPQQVVDALCTTKRYKSISRLRGSVVRIDKYHFATPAQCRATMGQPTVASVSTRDARRESARLWLVVDALTVIDDNELAVNPMPDLEEHAGVAKALGALPPAALEQRLALRQDLDLPRTTQPQVEVTPSKKSSEVAVGPSPAKMFGENVPLLDDDCEIPEDQAQALAGLEGWGLPDALEQPTDSQLIAENGPVSGSGESQPISSGNTIVSASSNTVVSSSSDATSPDGKPRVVVPETEPPVSSSPSQIAQGDASVPDSQDSHFKRVNLKKTFLELSDTDSGDEGFEHDVSSQPEQLSQAKKASTPQLATSKTSASQEATSSQETESQLSPQPMTQVPDLSSSLTLSEATPEEPAEESQAAGEFVGAVAANHEEPMTQVGDESQLQSQLEVPSSMGSVEWGTQAPYPSQSLEIPSDQETIDVEYEMNGDEETTEHPDGDEEDRGDRPTESQQDGQADHWMESQPRNASPARSKRSQTESPAREPPSSGGLTLSQRRKRRRTLDPSTDPLPMSPQEPTAKAARTTLAPSASTTLSSSTRAAGTASTRALTPDADAFASFVAPGDSASATPLALGISAFSKKLANPQLQRLRPSNRYQHLLPAFDFDAILHMISDKTE